MLNSLNLENRLMVSIIPENLDQFLKDIKECSTNLVEHRIDGFSDSKNMHVIYSDFTVDFLVTCRPKANEADSHEHEKVRMQILKHAILNGAKFVDIEIETEPNLRQELLAFAKEHGVKTVISFHNYEKTPSPEELEKIIQEMQKSKADIMKCVCMAHSYSDAHIMIDLQHKWSEKIIAFGMGSFGSFSRVLSLLYGAPFMYVPLNKKTAPGQLYIKEVKELLNLLDQN